MLVVEQNGQNIVTPLSLNWKRISAVFSDSALESINAGCNAGYIKREDLLKIVEARNLAGELSIAKKINDFDANRAWMAVLDAEKTINRISDYCFQEADFIKADISYAKRIGIAPKNAAIEGNEPAVFVGWGMSHMLQNLHFAVGGNFPARAFVKN